MKRHILALALVAISPSAMADYALVLNKNVVQVEARTFPVSRAFLWVKTPDGVAVRPGWRYDGGFIAPPAKPAAPSEADRLESAIVADPKFRALVRALAEDKGKTEQQIIDWLKSKL